MNNLLSKYAIMENIEFQRETEKAILFKYKEYLSVWIPKSVINKNNKNPNIIEINNNFYNENIRKIEIHKVVISFAGRFIYFGDERLNYINWKYVSGDTKFHSDIETIKCIYDRIDNEIGFDNNTEQGTKMRKVDDIIGSYKNIYGHYSYLE
jgi:hypothetical protein